MNCDAVIVDRRSRPFLGMDGGASETEINGHTVQIVGSYALGPDFMANGTVMMSERTYAALLAGNAGSSAGHAGRVRDRQIAAGRRYRDGASRRCAPRCRTNCGS